MSEDYRTVGVHMPEEWIDHADELADEYDTSRAAVLRELIDLGFIAHQEEDLPFDPWNHERRGAIEMTEDGEHPRWSDSKPHW